MSSTMLHTMESSFITYRAIVRSMKMTHPNNLKLLMARDGISQADIARAWGVENGDASQRVNGKVRITQERARALTEKFGWSASEIYDEIDKNPQIPVLGNIGAGDVVCPIDDLPLTNGLKEHEYEEMNCDFVEAPPGGNYRGMVALRVIGESMQPYLHEGDIVYYSQAIRSGFNDYLNKRVIVMLKDGRAFIKILRRGFDYNKYTLQSINTPTLIENVELLWVAKVAFIKPKD